MKLLTVVGARPQFIKAATVSRAIAAHNARAGAVPITERLVHTGQHYDDNMSRVFFDELGIPEPAMHLGIGSGPHGVQTARMLEALEPAIEREKPDFVLVYGDTNSTLAGALAAAKLQVPVAHVEAGLRSFNRRMPEEINRVLCDHLSSRLFCPTRVAVENLANEGITRGVERVGDVMFDGMLHYRARASDAILSRLALERGGYAVATVHRAENTDDPQRLAAILRTLGEAARRIGRLVLPLHPRTRKIVAARGLAPDGAITVVEPVPYLEMIALMANARAILTDSGGMQKEAFFLQVPCITLRDETEWVETVECGANEVVGAKGERGLAALDRLVRGEWKADYSSAPYGGGRAAEAIVASLAGKVAEAA